MNEKIKRHALNVRYLSAYMGMPYTTLKNKLDPKQVKYSLTVEEENKLIKIIQRIAKEILKDFS